MTDIKEFAEKQMGISLMPWQAEIAQKIWDAREKGERLVLVAPRRYGWSTIRQVLTEANND